MSATLWKAYWEDNVDKLRRLLAPAGYNAVSQSPNLGGTGGSLGASPRAGAKSRKVSGHTSYIGGGKQGTGGIGKAEINSRDHAGLTILLRAASSTSENALPFVQALLEHPAIDIYVQDPESGWNVLHRALYAGNISIARLMLEKERVDFLGQTRVGQLIKTKDHEGNSPFDLYHATIGDNQYRISNSRHGSDSDSDSDDSSVDLDLQRSADPQALLSGDEVFTFGSNKNHNLGLGDEDDRQYPERVYLRRPEHAMHRVYEGFLGRSLTASDLAHVPAQIMSRPIVVQDVQLAKFHSAILTTDPVANLHMSGIGRGGRLGLGDENTRFDFTPVQGPLANRKVVQIALGQNHSMALTDNGELWSWGSNAVSQLGYSLPQTTTQDEDPMSVTPRQVFGPLKKEVIIGVAASAIHSVAFTGSSLYCWGKNVGQLALMDADSRSLDIQQIPRKVAASLFSSPICMVSAIDKATTCLLADHTVFVFTSYGYKNVKFPIPDIMPDRTMTRVPTSSRYETARNRITCIASGGETIAAVSERGDLFTMSLNHKSDTTEAATSTTNPSKIKNALSDPQCIWTARKDGVRSVDVGEHGSVIIGTFSGAVWRRVKRNKAKDAHVSGVDSKKRNYKFQRVPYVTNVVTVRSSVFGAFAAVRRDCRVMKDHIVVDSQTLWDDVGSLCCLNSFKSAGQGGGEAELRKKAGKQEELLRQRMGPLTFEILWSADLEKDLQQFLANSTFDRDDLGVSVSTSTCPDLEIPVHGWVLAARSSVLRDVLTRSRKDGTCNLPEILDAVTQDGTTTIVFHGLDLISLLNLVVYSYRDTVIPAWNYRPGPSMAYRYRQVRIEVMKLATRLNMASLEAAARLQVEPKRSMAGDFNSAVTKKAFLDSGDVLLELDGAEVTAHSSFLVRRCPWFTGLFRGHSSGGWLAGRRDQDPSGKIRIDLKHMDANAFSYVLRHLYADVGEELFDSVETPNLSDFTDLVMDVMSIANELMIDRVSQVCQRVMGRHVNTRNVAHFVNAISPCTVTSFKDRGLEYICLQMESMLENHSLDDLDEDLLFELDDVVRENQLAQLPISKSGRAEAELLEKYPELAEDIDEERRRRVRAMAFKNNQRDEERKLSSSLKAKFGSLDDSTFASPSPSGRRKSKAGQNAPFSPSIRPKASQADLMFDMDDEDDSTISSPIMAPQFSRSGRKSTAAVPELALGDSKSLDASSLNIEHDSMSMAFRPVQRSNIPTSPEVLPKAGNPWGSSTPLELKPALRDIMSEATGSGKSALSAGLSAQKGKDASVKQTQAKVSQKERKRQQMQAAIAAQEQANAPNQKPWETASPKVRAAPWKASEPAPKQSIKDMLATPQHAPSPFPPKPLVAAESSAKPISRRTASPDTRFAGQGRTASSSIMHSPAGSSTKLGSSTAPLVPHSKSYIKPAPKSDPLVGYGMADIIAQENRNKEIVKEAVAKRSLQEIQEEQAFQEWWDQESLRTQEEEARRAAREKDREEGKGRGRRGRSGRSRGGGSAAGARGGNSNNNQVAGGGGRGDGGGGNNVRGKGRGGKS